MNPFGQVEPSGSYDGEARVGLAVPMYFTADQLAGALYWGAPCEQVDLTPKEVRFWVQVALAAGGVREAEELGYRWQELPESTVHHTVPEHMGGPDAPVMGVSPDPWRPRVRAYIEQVYGVTPSPGEVKHVWTGISCDLWEY